jgi:translation elongation factor EF-G
MIHKVFLSFFLIGLTSCATLTPPDPVLVKKIDAYFNTAKSDTFEASEKYKRPIPYAVGQYIVTGTTHASERSVEKMALVGRQGDGWIIEMQSLAPSSESISQMLVKGMEAAQESGDIDGLDIVWIKIQSEDGSVETIQGPMLTMTKGLFKKALASLENKFQMPVDSTAVRVPAGTFNGAVKAKSNGAVMGKKYRADIWLHPSLLLSTSSQV